MYPVPVRASRITAAAILLIVGVRAEAQIGDTQRRGAQPDSRVRDCLDRIGWKYEVDGDGDYCLRFETPEGPTQEQVVFIRSFTCELGNLEIREVLAPYLQRVGSTDAGFAASLLCLNDKAKLGAWRIARNRDSTIPIFAAQIAANSDAESLSHVVRAVVAGVQSVDLALSVDSGHQVRIESGSSDVATELEKQHELITLLRNRRVLEGKQGPPARRR